MSSVTNHRAINRSEIRRILVRATNWVGDMVISLPALEAIRANFPESELAVIARPWVIPLIEGHPSVDRIIPLKKGTGLVSDLIEIIRVAGIIRKTGFDMAVLFQNAFEAALLAFLGGVRYRIGYNTGGRGFLLTHPISRDEQTLKSHQVEYYLAILSAMGWEAKSRNPALSVSDEEMEAVHSLLLSRGIKREDTLIGLSPGAIFGPAKRWPPERFAIIGDRAMDRWGTKSIIMGSPGENEICELVASSMRHQALDLCGKTDLRQAMALIKRCDFFITNDSGLMHVATALDVPMVAIFGSTDPSATGPLSPRARVVSSRADCSPCLKPECPLDFRCMLDITPEDVWKEVETIKEEIL